jgi:hypothetical protein
MSENLIAKAAAMIDEFAEQGRLRTEDFYRSHGATEAEVEAGLAWFDEQARAERQRTLAEIRRRIEEPRAESAALH